MAYGFVRKTYTMSVATFIHDARQKARFLVNRESAGSGDTPEAIKRLARKVRVPPSRLYSLIRRPQTLKSLCVSTYMALEKAYRAEVERQYRALEHEAALSEALLGADDPAVRASKAVLSAHRSAGQDHHQQAAE